MTIPAFRVFKTIPQLIPAAQFAKVNFNGVNGNSGGCWDAENQLVRLDRTGWWQLFAGIYWSGLDPNPSMLLVPGQAIELHMVKNGSPTGNGVFVASDCRAAAGSGGQSNILPSGPFYANQGDEISLYAFQNPGNGTMKRINDDWTSVCWFAGAYIGDNG